MEKISYVLDQTTIKQETYEMTIVDYKSNLYQNKGTDYFAEYRSMVGYYSYSGKTGLLEVGSLTWSSKFYIKPLRKLQIKAVWYNGWYSDSYDSFVVSSNGVLRLNFCNKYPPLG